jgi:hypothetical protein
VRLVTVRSPEGPEPLDDLRAKPDTRLRQGLI